MEVRVGSNFYINGFFPFPYVPVSDSLSFNYIYLLFPMIRGMCQSDLSLVP